jgi:hypothetical protein
MSLFGLVMSLLVGLLLLLCSQAKDSPSDVLCGVPNAMEAAVECSFFGVRSTVPFVSV